MTFAPSRTRRVATVIATAASLAIAACSKKETAVPAPSRPGVATSIVSGGSASLPTPAITIWDDSLGGMLAIVSMERGAPVFFSRDTLAAAPRTVELFSHDTQVQLATLVPGAPVRECARERSATITTPDHPGVPVWSLALDTGVAKPIAIDGLDDLLPRDSSAMIVRLRKLAGTLPEDSISGAFSGLPVVVREAWRVMASDGTPVWITLSTRTLGTESNPRLELLTMIAEPEPGSRDAMRIVWSRRESGPEEKVVGADLLAALTLRGSRMMLAMARSGDHGDEIEFIDRVQPGAWRLRWSSTSLGCSVP